MCVRVPAEANTLETRELTFEEKKLVIEMKANDQGKFVKIMEVSCSGVSLCNILCSIHWGLPLS